MKKISQNLKANIKLNEKGDVNATIERTSQGLQYDYKSYFIDYSEEELIKNYKTNIWSYNNNLEVNSVVIENDKNNIVFKEALEVSIKKYATVNKEEILFRVNVFNKGGFVPKRYRTRKLPLRIYRGYKDVDIYSIEIPESYKLEYLPQNTEIKTKFGSYSVSFEKVDDHKFLYKKTILIKEGIYPKEDYKNYRKFRKSIAKLENIRIALLKK